MSSQKPIEARIMDFFSTAHIERAEAIYKMVQGVMAERRKEIRMVKSALDSVKEQTGKDELPF